MHKTCVGIEVELPKNEPWFCDYCMFVEKEKLLREKSDSRVRDSSGSSPTDEACVPLGDDDDRNGGSVSDALLDGRDDASRKRRLKKRRKTKFYNDRKAKRKRQMQMSAMLENDVIQLTKASNPAPNPQSYVWQHSEGVVCFFCRLPYGALMKLAKPANSWGHISCGYWLPHTNPYIPYRLIYITARGFKELAQRSHSRCAYCKQGEGMMVKCFARDCPVHFHVECGRRSFCELKFPYQLKIKQKEHVAFCFQHSQTFNSRRIEQSMLTEWSQMKNVLKSFKNHHVASLHFDQAAQLKKTRPKKLVVHLRRVGGPRDPGGFAFVKTSFE